MYPMRLQKRSLLLVSFFVLQSCLWCCRAAYGGSDEERVVITSDHIKTYKVNRIYELLNQVPGVKASSSSVSIRGSSKVKVLLDGRAIDDPTSRSGVIKWDQVNLESVERIEIMKSAGGVVYGDNSSGGVISITSKKIDSFNTDAELSLGSHGQQVYRLGSQAHRGSWGLGLNAGYDNTDGFKTNNDKEKMRLGPKLSYRFHDDMDLDLSGMVLQEKKGHPGRVDSPTPFSRSTYDLVSSQLSFTAYEYKSETSFHQGKKHNTDPEQGLDTILEVTKFGQEVTRKASKDSKKHWLASIDSGTGFEWGKADATSFGRQKEKKAWLFMSKTVALSSLPLSVNIGARYIYYSEFDNAFNPAVQIGYRRDNWSARFIYNRTSNTPTFRQRYNQTSSTDPNPDLDKETADNFSVVTTFQPADSLSLSLAVFYNKLSDRISYIYNSGTGRYENLGKASYQGSDMSLSAKPFSTVTTKLSYTYLIARDDTNDLYLTSKAKHRLVADLSYQPTEQFSLGLMSKSYSEMYNRSDNTTTVPGYTVINLRAEYKWQKVETFMEANNLFDKYYVHGDGYQGSPLTWRLGLKFHFRGCKP